MMKKLLMIGLVFGAAGAAQAADFEIRFGTFRERHCRPPPRVVYYVPPQPVGWAPYWSSYTVARQPCAPRIAYVSRPIAHRRGCGW